MQWFLEVFSLNICQTQTTIRLLKSCARSPPDVQNIWLKEWSKMWYLLKKNKVLCLRVFLHWYVLYYRSVTETHLMAPSALSRPQVSVFLTKAPHSTASSTHFNSKHPLRLIRGWKETPSAHRRSRHIHWQCHLAWDSSKERECVDVSETDE